MEPGADPECEPGNVVQDTAAVDVVNTRSAPDFPKLLLGG